MKVLKVFLTVGILILSVTSHAAWKLRSAYKAVPGSDVERSVLYFTSEDQTKTYAPGRPPYGLVDSERYLFLEGEFYLTTWAHGAQSVVFKVFDMSKDTATPICEIGSFGELSSLKLKNGVLYVAKIDDLDQIKPTWSACSRIESRN